MVGNAVPPLLAKAVGTHILSLRRLPVPQLMVDPLPREESLVAADVQAAAASGYESRRVSQMVVSWSKKG
jgi:hypothetical protein